MAFYTPQPLADLHTLDEFDSGEPSLDDWLRRRARANQASGASRTFVTCNDERVIGYYALASGAVATAEATGRFRRNMPEPIPVAVLARLAIDRRYQKQGIGRALIRDGTARVLSAAEVIGIRGIVVHAISEDAKAFYTAFGFNQSPLDPMMLMIALADLRSGLAA